MWEIDTNDPHLDITHPDLCMITAASRSLSCSATFSHACATQFDERYLGQAGNCDYERKNVLVCLSIYLESDQCIWSLTFI